MYDALILSVKTSLGFFYAAENTIEPAVARPIFGDMAQIHEAVLDDLQRHSMAASTFGSAYDPGANDADTALINFAFDAMAKSVASHDAIEVISDLRVVEFALLLRMCAEANNANNCARRRALELHVRALRMILKSVDFLEKGNWLGAEWSLYSSGNSTVSFYE